MDEFTSPSERKKLKEQWAAFLASGGAEGWYQLYVPDRGPVPIEFSATANVLPARHLSVFIPPEEASAEAKKALASKATWAPVVAEGTGRLPLTEREREVMTLVASGFRAVTLRSACFSLQRPSSLTFITRWASSEHTHAVAIALVTGQITWEI